MREYASRYLFVMATGLIVFALVCAGCVQYPDQSGNLSSNNSSAQGNITNGTRTLANGTAQTAVPGPTIPPRGQRRPTIQVTIEPGAEGGIPGEAPEGAVNETGNLSDQSLLLVPTPGTTQQVRNATPVATPLPPPTPAPTNATYTNEAYKFSLVYPLNWTKEESPTVRTGIVVKFHSPVVSMCNARNEDCADYVGTFSVSVDPNPQPPTLEEYFNRALGGLQQKYQITATTKNSQATLSGNKAYSINYITKDSRGNPDKEVMQYYSILYGKAYVLTYSAGYYEKRDTMFGDYEEPAERMIGSFRVEKPPPIEG